MTIREPRWTEQDRAEILALAHHREHHFCPCGCGLPAVETLKPEGDGPDFIPAQTVCQARLRLLESQRAVVEERGSENAPARLWTIEMRKR